jgi:hypothetical protein
MYFRQICLKIKYIVNEGEHLSEEKKVIYSWSKLNSFYQAQIGEGCYLSWKNQYIDGERGEGNYFTEYGLLLHETIEKLHKNQIFPWDIENELNNGICNFQYSAPFKKMEESYKKALFDFFDPDTFEEIFKDYEILESEEEVLFQIGDITMKGFPDLIAKHKKYGLVIADYKSSKVYSSSKLIHNIRQLYIYSIPVYEKYGQYPSKLIYIFPREKEKREYIYDFDPKKLEETKQWVIDTVAAIEKWDKWEPRCKTVDTISDFYSNALCGFRNTCNFRCSNK